MMDLAFLSQADSVTLKLELAKVALEAAKNNLEAAKQAHDELLAQSDSHGIPKAKLKKLTEDRVQSIFESGILTTMGHGETHKSVVEVKRDRLRKTAKKPEDESVTEALLVSEIKPVESFLGEPDTVEVSHEGRS